ncbi:MAG: ABC transporter permease [Dethiobacteria bacterium]|jgi:putative ABC transport system permease protein|nr:ABC transporter permease [Bacillota bacterium]NMD33506.1 ABC transporter permease [Bacillota bacterium]HOB29608.1 ABC transporter permease [Bacillota bacterium]HPZ42236.1 ABC transporter permease [Bacillota bacterium]HQD52210.1 ABC transporter permease [Bacillota bacterium]
MNLATVLSSVELGVIYAIMSLGVFISFRTLNMPDLTVDGSFVLGAAVSAVLCTAGRPLAGIILALAAGALAGSVTALLHTKLKIQPILSGILTMLALYSINLKVMGNRANIPLLNQKTIFNLPEWMPGPDYAALIISLLLLFTVMILLYFFLKTKIGLVLRATGDNEQMVRALGVSTDLTKLIGLALANALVALSGALIAQYQSFADVGMGIGMVIIGLASVIIGEAIFGTSNLLRRLIAVILGSIVYRLAIAFALELGMPPTDLKLISAVIVCAALSMPTIKEQLSLLQQRYTAAVNNRGRPL